MNYSKTLVAAALAGLMGAVPAVSAQDITRGDRAIDVRPIDRDRDHDSDGIRVRCGSTGMTEISLRSHYARYRNRGIAFGAVVEAQSRGLLESGDVLDVYLAGVPVGMVTMTQLDNGELAGRISLRYQPDVDPSRTDVDLGRIVVRQGSSVVVGPLGCALTF